MPTHIVGGDALHAFLALASHSISDMRGETEQGMGADVMAIDERDWL
ncbi:hypothetical protein [Dokdonella sp.]